MGIRFKANTWRAPLRLIDNLLPDGQVKKIAVAPEKKPLRLIDAFKRAGWLKGNGPRNQGPTAGLPVTVPATKPCSVRVMRSFPTDAGPRRDMKLVISGRIGDVCAELDRLAAQEQSSHLRRV